MEYKNDIIHLTPQEQSDLDCGDFSDRDLDEVIVDTDCLLSFKTSRVNSENTHLFGGARGPYDTQLYDPQLLRLRIALHQLEIVKLERDANATLK